MLDSEKKILLVIVAATGFMSCSDAHNHTVGDSIWSIPLNKDFYTNWSSTQTFVVGDSLGLYNVMHVSRGDYDECAANSPLRAFSTGPATVPLQEDGVYYFLCSLGNYCLLGLKFFAQVQEPSNPLPTPTARRGLLPEDSFLSSSPSPHPHIESSEQFA